MTILGDDDGNKARERERDQIRRHLLASSKNKMRGTIAIGAIISGANPIPRKPRGRASRGFRHARAA
jgi:hypothetical protein